MKTSLDIPTLLLQETREISKATTNRKAVIIALTEYVRREKLKEAVSLLGTFEGLPSTAELQNSRRKMPLYRFRFCADGYFFGAAGLVRRL